MPGVCHNGPRRPGFAPPRHTPARPGLLRAVVPLRVLRRAAPAGSKLRLAPQSVLRALHRPFLALPATVPRSFHSPCTRNLVSRPAGSPELNLRGRLPYRAVPANGCLARLPPWPNSATARHSEIYFVSPQRFGRSLTKCRETSVSPLTFPYHGCRRPAAQNRPRSRVAPRPLTGARALD